MAKIVLVGGVSITFDEAAYPGKTRDQRINNLMTRLETAYNHSASDEMKIEVTYSREDGHVENTEGEELFR